MNVILYLSSFLFSGETVTNPNIYPYNVFAGRGECILVFAPVTVLYGNNASGKSTMLNIMANKLKLKGQEYATSNKYGRVEYFPKFVKGCRYSLGEQEDGRQLDRLPPNSRYVKSEDIPFDTVPLRRERRQTAAWQIHKADTGVTKSTGRKPL